MKIIDRIRTYCPHCRKHTIHKVVKVVKKGQASPFSWGERQHKRKLRGYVGKVAGTKPVRKRGKHQKALIECSECKKKQERIIGSRTEKILEIVKAETK